jgi:hypothetical protein
MSSTAKARGPNAHPRRPPVIGARLKKPRPRRGKDRQQDG